MSIRLMSEVFELEGPKGAHRLVLLALADNANDEGVCWPAVSTIARKAGIDVRRAQRVIKELVEMGLITITYRPGPDGKNLTNVYQLNLAVNPTPEEPKQAEKAAYMGGAGATHRMAPVPPTGGAGTTQRVARVPPESSLKPSVNHQSTAAAAAGANEKVIEAYHRWIGYPGKGIRLELWSLEKSYTPEWVIAAIHECSVSGGKSLKYVKQILERWKVDGFKVENKPVRTINGERARHGVSKVEGAAYLAERKAMFEAVTER